MKNNNIWRITLDTNPEDCNFNCIMCEEHSEYSTYKQKLFEETGVKRRVMPSEWLSKIFKEAKELGVSEIIPSTMGEPLLYKNFETILELCKAYDIKLNLTTNGSFPGKNSIEWAKLIIPVTSDIKISWNGATKDTFEKIMKGSNYENQISNIKKLIEYRDKYLKKTGYYCTISFQLTFMQNNMHELPDIVKLAALLGIDRIKGHHLWTHFKEIKELSFKRSHESILKWNSIVKKAFDVKKNYNKNTNKKIFLDIYPLNYDDFQIPKDYYCPFLNRELWISAVGKISPCCAPDEMRDSLGNFGYYPETKLYDVVHSKQYLELVTNYKNYSLCKTCLMRKPEVK